MTKCGRTLRHRFKERGEWQVRKAECSGELREVRGRDGAPVARLCSVCHRAAHAGPRRRQVDEAPARCWAQARAAVLEWANKPCSDGGGGPRMERWFDEHPEATPQEVAQQIRKKPNHPRALLRMVEEHTWRAG